jgi:predicted phage tail protein
VTREVHSVIAGSGGGKGGAGGGGLSERPDTLRSKAYAQVLDLVCEGEIGGLVNGLKSIYLNDTPIQNPDGSYNFTDINYASTTGTQTQPVIAGYDQVRNEVAVDTEAKISTGPVVQSISNLNITSVIVNVECPSLSYLDDKGNLGGSEVNFAIDVQNNGGGYVEKINDTLRGKSSSVYQRQYRIGLPAGGPWDIRLRRITPDAVTTATNNKTIFRSYTQVIDAKLRYPNSALVALKVDASQFRSIPTRGYDMELLLVRFPSNATVRADGSLEYSGTWDGTFQVGWCNDPAWCYYDALTNVRYGLGRFVSDAITDKWQLYTISKYCSALVSDGFGGLEPRFSCNVYFQTRRAAFEVINDFTSLFRGMPYWSAGSVTCAQDAPADPVYLYTNSNVAGDGKFKYSGSSAKARHTVALVAWSDPDDMCRQKIEYVENPAGIARYGIIETDPIAFGCTSRGQAHRLGRWLLYTEYYETDVVSFTTGEEGAFAAPGQIILVADQYRAGVRLGGRVSSATTTSVVLDSLAVPPTGAVTLYVVDASGVARSAAVSSISGTTVNLVSPLTFEPAPQSQWVLSSASVEPRHFRVLGAKETDDGHYEITALSHNPDKFALIENGLTLQQRSYSSLSPVPAAVSSVTLTEALYTVGNDVRSKINASWPAVQGASEYRVEWRQADGNFGEDKTASLDYDILNTAVQKYEVKVTAIGVFGTPSQSSTTATINALGKTAPPANVTGLTYSIDGTIGVSLAWANNDDLDLDLYEVRVGASWDAGTLVTRQKASALKLGQISGSSQTFWVKAIDTTGNYSVTAASVTTVVTVPSAPTVSVQIVDNNVLLKWTAPTASLNIDLYEIRRGATWAGGTVVGKGAGTFATIFETAAGVYTYWIAAIDIAGNYGTPASVAAPVAAPPDYQLLNDFNSTYSGTKTNAFVSDGALYMAVDTSETWQSHFTARGWTTPQDQITGGYANYIQPTLTTASYEEVIDQGATIPSAKITLTGNYTVVTGAATLTPKISVSNTSGTGPWTDYAGVSTAFATSFRWVKVRFDLTSAGGDDIVRFDGINVKLDVKQKSDMGYATANSGDAGGTTVNFGASFTSVTSITVTPKGTTARIAIYDFAGGINPTNFKVLLFDTSGTRVTGDVSWAARGY